MFIKDRCGELGSELGFSSLLVKLHASCLLRLLSYYVLLCLILCFAPVALIMLHVAVKAGMQINCPTKYTAPTSDMFFLRLHVIVMPFFSAAFTSTLCNLVDDFYFLVFKFKMIHFLNNVIKTENIKAEG